MTASPDTGHVHIGRRVKTNEGMFNVCECGYSVPTSPTENTEDELRQFTMSQELFDAYKKYLRLDDMTMVQFAEVVFPLIASSNHQAVQAFGEKVHNKYRDIDGDCAYCDGTAYSAQHDEIVSAITSLLKGGVK